jgi:thioredoxin-dependent peroxiredoxin
MAEWIEEGKKAPAFSLLNDNNERIRLSNFKGQYVVLYFYPKDDTPGCTTEACAFNAALAKIKKLGAVVLGISPDTVESHAKFRDKFGLKFPLLSDDSHKVAEKFGAWREKNMYGKKMMGVQRSTFLIDPTGKIVKSWTKVTVEGHDQEVLSALQLSKSGDSKPILRN